MVIVVVVLKLAMGGRQVKVLLWLLFFPAFGSVFVSNYLLDKYNSSVTSVCWSARWAGFLGTMGLSGFIALCLIYSTQQEKVVEVVKMTHEQLSTVSYVILSIVFLLIICGFGWCFYRALTAASKDGEIQLSDEIGDQ